MLSPFPAAAVAGSGRERVGDGRRSPGVAKFRLLSSGMKSEITQNTQLWAAGGLKTAGVLEGKGTP